MPSRARALSEADREVWARFAVQIAPLSGRAGAGLPDPPPAARNAQARQTIFATAAKARTVAAPLCVGSQPGGLDKATWQRFRSGKLTAARRLDLHGMTADRAFHALVAFLRTSHADQIRCVEVVTGRGSGETGGVIRRELPHWLNLPQIRPLILAAAHPHALNPGSVRLILRRIR